jgi:chromate reductase, NAD(P)H dehydrogenase (quinone)
LLGSARPSTVNVLAIAGSLRAASVNAAFCRAAARLAPAGLEVSVYTGLGALPHFNPDLEHAPPPAVLRLRAEVARADALLLASPEYAQGVSGVMKNALDWLVSFEGFVHKPVAVVNTSARAHHAYDALVETLRTMSAAIVADASITLPLPGPIVAEEAIINSPDLSTQVRRAMAALHGFLADQYRGSVAMSSR